MALDDQGQATIEHRMSGQIGQPAACMMESKASLEVGRSRWK
jgi:hypothetical protein